MRGLDKALRRSRSSGGLEEKRTERWRVQERLVMVNEMEIVARL